MPDISMRIGQICGRNSPTFYSDKHVLAVEIPKFTQTKGWQWHMQHNGNLTSIRRFLVDIATCLFWELVGLFYVKHSLTYRDCRCQ